jgi:ABC-type amino acid transport substrate-binding protein
MRTNVMQRTGRRRSRRWMALVAPALAIVGFAQASQASDLADVKARGKLVVEVFPIFGNKAFSVNVDVLRDQGLKVSDLRHADQFRGFDAELLKGFADSFGVELEIHAVTSRLNELLPALARRECDLVAGGITITPKRLEMADFSRPYYTSWLAVVVRRDSSIASLDGLAGKTGAVLAGSSHLEILQKVAPRAKIEPVSYQSEAIERIDGGTADFTVEPTDLGPGEPFSSAARNLKIAFRLSLASVGIAARKGSDLLPALDAYLEKLRVSGELDRILERNGAVKAKIPSTP